MRNLPTDTTLSVAHAYHRRFQHPHENTVSNLSYPITFKGLEFGTFRLKAGVSESAMLAAAQVMENEFLRQEEGFLGHAILKGHDGAYVDLAFATSRAKAEEICGKWLQNPHALAFLAFIDPASTHMSFWSRLQ
jgi:hypothetical protein